MNKIYDQSKKVKKRSEFKEFVLPFILSAMAVILATLFWFLPEMVADSDFEVGKCYDKIADEDNPFDMDAPGTVFCIVEYSKGYYLHKRYQYYKEGAYYLRPYLDTYTAYDLYKYGHIVDTRVCKEPKYKEKILKRSEMRLTNE